MAKPIIKEATVYEVGTHQAYNGEARVRGGAEGLVFEMMVPEKWAEKLEAGQKLKVTIETK